MNYLSNGAFSGLIQTHWDSTSLGAFKTCPRYYEYRLIHGWVTKETSVHLHFGIAIHRALETYDRKIALGASHDDATGEAIRAALFATGARDGEVWKKWKSEDPNKNLWTLIRAVVWYLEQFGESDPAQTVILSDGKPAVELHFEFDLGQGISLCGHLDRLVEHQGVVGFMDRKSTKSTLSSYYFDQFSPDNQMSMYTLGSQVVWSTPVGLGILDAIQVAQGFCRFQRGLVHRTPAQIDEFILDTTIWVNRAIEAAERRHWEMNDKACFRCDYRFVCQKDPSVRESFLQSNYVKQTWDPSKPRGEL